MKTVYVDALLMENGEVIHRGRSLGYQDHEVDVALSESLKNNVSVIFLK